MAGASRWADDEADAAEAARRKKEKEEKKRAKQLKQQQEQAQAQSVSVAAGEESSSRPFKRRKLSPSPEKNASKSSAPEGAKVLRFDGGGWGPCRHVSNFETLNHIEEGSYGWVSRAKEIETGEVVALKKVKMDYAGEGFPVTALREISILQKAKHQNIVNLKEVVMGDSLDE
jgi:cell division cycle 2-like protein